jgi:hypothetical protein
MMLSLAATAAIALTAMGCHRRKSDAGPNCRQIVSYMVRFPEFGAFDMTSAIKQCEQAHWSAAQRQCLYTARDVEAMTKCVPKMKVEPSKGPSLELPSWHPQVDKPLGEPTVVPDGSGGTAPGPIPEVPPAPSTTTSPPPAAPGATPPAATAPAAPTNGK